MWLCSCLVLFKLTYQIFSEEFLLGRGVIERNGYFYFVIFLSSLSSLQTPEVLARSSGKHEAVKVLKEYAEVWWKAVCWLGWISLSFKAFSLCLIFITHFLSLFLSFILSMFWLQMTLILNAAGGRKRACVWLESHPLFI